MKVSNMDSLNKRVKSKSAKKVEYTLSATTLAFLSIYENKKRSSNLSDYKDVITDYIKRYNHQVSTYGINLKRIKSFAINKVDKFMQLIYDDDTRSKKFYEFSQIFGFFNCLRYRNLSSDKDIKYLQIIYDEFKGIYGENDIYLFAPYRINQFRNLYVCSSKAHLTYNDWGSVVGNLYGKERMIELPEGTRKMLTLDVLDNNDYVNLKVLLDYNSDKLIKELT